MLKNKDRAIQVIESCKTVEQVKVAHAYMLLMLPYVTEDECHQIHEAYLTKTLKVTGLI